MLENFKETLIRGIRVGEFINKSSLIEYS